MVGCWPLHVFREPASEGERSGLHWLPPCGVQEHIISKPSVPFWLLGLGPKTWDHCLQSPMWEVPSCRSGGGCWACRLTAVFGAGRPGAQRGSCGQGCSQDRVNSGRQISISGRWGSWTTAAMFGLQANLFHDFRGGGVQLWCHHCDHRYSGQRTPESLLFRGSGMYGRARTKFAQGTDAALAVHPLSRHVFSSLGRTTTWDQRQLLPGEDCTGESPGRAHGFATNHLWIRWWSPRPCQSSLCSVASMGTGESEKTLEIINLFEHFEAMNGNARLKCKHPTFFLPGPRLSVDLIELNLQEAEVAKLFLNSWRYVAFGIANQFPGPKMVWWYQLVRIGRVAESQSPNEFNHWRKETKFSGLPTDYFEFWMLSQGLAGGSYPPYNPL